MRVVKVWFGGMALWATLALLSASAQPFVTTKAPAAIILDHDSGEILFAKNADTPVAPASMSKLMTAAVVLDLIAEGRYRPTTPFDVSEKAWRTSGSEMFVLVDTQIVVLDLLKGLIVQSGNDAAIVLAENIAGSEAAFARLMNEKAQAWGLTQSSFNNPTGFDHPDQKMSVRDLAALTRLIWNRFPEYRYLFAMPEFTWSEITQRNRNPLLGVVEGADGMKTGHTDASGYHLVGSATRAGTRRIIVLAGLETQADRTREGIRMMDLAFDGFETATYFLPGDEVGTAAVFGAEATSVPLVVRAPVQFLRHTRQLERARARIVYEGPLVAPVRKGDQVAILRLTMPGEADADFPLYAGETVRGLGPIAKIKNGFTELFTLPQAAE